jgi:predicted GNAT family acetyltransferase
MHDILHNPDEQRFESDINGSLAVLLYQREGQRIAFTHTQVPPQARNQGIGGALARAALDYAAAEQLQVLPLCSFIADFIDRNPQYRRLLASPPGGGGGGLDQPRQK